MVTGRSGYCAATGRAITAAITASVASNSRIMMISSSCGLLIRALLCGFLALAQVERGVDERHVRKRLREVAEQAPRDRVVFLGEEANVVGEAEQPLEELVRLVPATLHAEVVREP